MLKEKFSVLNLKKQFAMIHQNSNIFEYEYMTEKVEIFLFRSIFVSISFEPFSKKQRPLTAIITIITRKKKDIKH